MNYFQRLTEEHKAEQQAQVEATKQAPKPKPAVLLSFWRDEFTFSDGTKEMTGKLSKLSKGDRKNHINQLVARANEVAAEQKAQLIVSDAGHAVMAYCADYR